ncbi:MAG TPA: hypothetical protein VGB83_08985 [Actinomycetota bacterium]
MRVMAFDDFLEQVDGSEGGSRSPDWNTLVQQGRAARQAADGGRWRIGELASTIERRYASGALKRFADEIGESLGSVRRFRWVFESYDAAARIRFRDLAFSHFQAVAALSDRLAWLERAQRMGWSVDHLTVQSRRAGIAGGAARMTALRRPIDSAARSLARLTESVVSEPLPTAERTTLLGAVDELAAHLETLRAELKKRRRPKLRRV